MVCLIFEGSFPDPYIPCSSVPVVAARAQETSVFSVALPDGGGCFEPFDHCTSRTVYSFVDKIFQSFTPLIR